MNNQGYNEPFDHFWSLYRAHCPRMQKKPQCKVKFERFTYDDQKMIYRDVRDRLKHYPGWADKDEYGKRAFMCGPHPYLTGQMWLDPVDKIKRVDNVRDTSHDIVPLKVRLAGLRTLIKQVSINDGDITELEAQVKKLEAQYRLRSEAIG